MRIPKSAIFLAGILAGAVSRALTSTKDVRRIDELKRSVDDLGTRVAEQADQQDARFQQLDARLDEHEERLNAVPSTPQIVSAMEDLLSKTMSCLDQRLSTQAHSIEILKTTVSQTDQLLERVLESLDALRGNAEESPPHPAESAGK